VALDAADDGPSAAAHERSGAGSGGPVIERLQGADDHPACMARINRTPAAGCGVTMPRRSVLIDGLKVLASQLIVLHHMMLYAPMADLVAPGWPSAATFLTGEARFAVQVFLVVGGFLAAQGLARGTLGLPRLVLVRYLRLVPMLAVALLAVLAASALLPPGRWSEWVTPWPSPWDFLAHLLLLQDLLHIPSLSAGAWYVSIDFQLYVLLGLGAALLHRSADRPAWQSPLPWAVALLALASLFVFNRNAALDAWAPYFFSA
jgi:peptidoglycan/LPS O-acetylase OafA/YrhL